MIDGACDPAAARSLVGTRRDRGRATPDASFGAGAVELELAIAGAADDFAQASAEGNRALGEVVAAALGPGADRALLELYAGARQPHPPRAPARLARHGDRRDRARARARRRRVDHGDCAAGARAARRPRVRRRAARFRRAPARATRSARIAATQAARIIYVSCDPATLARDAQTLVAAGFAARRAVPLDLMPDTAHVEVVLTLERA